MLQRKKKMRRNGVEISYGKIDSFLHSDLIVTEKLDFFLEQERKMKKNEESINRLNHKQIINQFINYLLWGVENEYLPVP